MNSSGCEELKELNNKRFDGIFDKLASGVNVKVSLIRKGS